MEWSGRSGQGGRLFTTCNNRRITVPAGDRSCPSPFCSSEALAAAQLKRRAIVPLMSMAHPLAITSKLATITRQLNVICFKT